MCCCGVQSKGDVLQKAVEHLEQVARDRDLLRDAVRDLDRLILQHGALAQQLLDSATDNRNLRSLPHFPTPGFLPALLPASPYDQPRIA